MVWTEFSWFRIRSNGGLWWTWLWTCMYDLDLRIWKSLVLYYYISCLRRNLLLSNQKRSPEVFDQSNVIKEIPRQFWKLVFAIVASRPYIQSRLTWWGKISVLVFRLISNWRAEFTLLFYSYESEQGPTLCTVSCV